MSKSIGVSELNEGTTTILDESKYVVDYSRKYHLIDVVPMGAVRMTQSDKWKTNPNHKDPKKRQRDSVRRYFEAKNKVVETCNKTGFKIGNHLEVVFFMPMPDSWSSKKKERMNGMPNKSRPDVDNCLKFLMDSLLKEDGMVWSVNAQKRYAYKGSILIYE
jgi:Holliday junction resolvase RusA-like endonuclease